MSNRNRILNSIIVNAAIIAVFFGLVLVIWTAAGGNTLKL